MAPVVRRAVFADGVALTRMRLDFVEASHPDRAVPDEFVHATRLFFERHLAAPGPIVFWVAEADGQIIAHAALILFQKLPNLKNLGGLEGYVSNVFTLAAHRRRGLAAALLHVVMADARERGIGRLWLYTSEDGEPLYARAGFERAVSDTPMMELDLAKLRTLRATLDESIAAGGYIDDSELDASLNKQAEELRQRGIGE